MADHQLVGIEEELLEHGLPGALGQRAAHSQGNLSDGAREGRGRIRHRLLGGGRAQQSCKEIVAALGRPGVEPLEELVGQRSRRAALYQHQQHGLAKQLEARRSPGGLVQHRVDEGEEIAGGAPLEGLEHQLAPHRGLAHVPELALQLLGFLAGQWGVSASGPGRTSPGRARAGDRCPRVWRPREARCRGAPSPGDRYRAGASRAASDRAPRSPPARSRLR